MPRGSGFEFHEKVVGGAVPRNYIGASNEGVVDGLLRGPLGFPRHRRPCRADRRFPITASTPPILPSVPRPDRGQRSAAGNAMPVLLEPIHLVEIVCPTDATAGSMPSCRAGAARFSASTPRGLVGWDCVRATMPNRDRRSDRRVALGHRGAGSFTRQFDRMAEVTGRAADQIIAAHRRRGVVSRRASSRPSQVGIDAGLPSLPVFALGREKRRDRDEA